MTPEDIAEEKAAWNKFLIEQERRIWYGKVLDKDLLKEMLEFAEKPLPVKEDSEEVVQEKITAFEQILQDFKPEPQKLTYEYLEKTISDIFFPKQDPGLPLESYKMMLYNTATGKLEEMK